MPEAIALPDLAILLWAVALMAVAAAIGVLAFLLAHSLGKLPVVGGWITVHLIAYLFDAQRELIRLYRDAFNAAGQLMKWAWHWWARFTIAEWDFALRVTQGIYHLATVSVPQAIVHAEQSALAYARRAELYAAGRVLALEHAVTAAFVRVEATIENAYDLATAYAARLAAEAVAFARSEVQAAERLAAGELARLGAATVAELARLRAAVAADFGIVEHFAVSLFDRAERDLTAGLADVERTTEAAIAAQARVIYTDLEQWPLQALRDAWPDAEGDVASLGRTLGADFPWLKDLLPLLAGAGLSGLLGALIRSMATSQALTRLAEDCIVPNCRNLSGLGNDLANLSALFTAGTLFAWVAEGVASPSGWAQDVAGVLGPVGDRVTGQAKSTFGVG